MTSKWIISPYLPLPAVSLSIALMALSFSTAPNQLQSKIISIFDSGLAIESDSRHENWTLYEKHGVHAQGAWDKLNNEAFYSHELPVVAVLDLGTFIDQEDFYEPTDDFKSKHWVNPHEIDNGIDDDNNGYVDDIHGINGYFGKLPSPAASTAVWAAYKNRLKSYVGIKPDDDASQLEQQHYQIRLNRYEQDLVENGNPNPYQDRATLKASGDHGTNTASTIVADSSNNLGGQGINDQARLLSCNVGSGMGSSEVNGTALSNCINYVIEQKRAGANIIAVNLSLGTNGKHDSKAASIWASFVKRLAKEKIIVVAAAGNAVVGASGLNNDTDGDGDPFFPASLEGHANLISVTGHLSSAELAMNVANYGRATVDIAAPISAYGAHAIYEDDGSLNINQYKKKSGTSKSTPLVTGAVTLVYQYLLSQGKFTVESYDIQDMINVRNLVVGCGTYDVSLIDTTTSGRRLRMTNNDGTGLLSCVQQHTQKHLRPNQETAYELKIGESTKVTYLDFSCDYLECTSGPEYQEAQVTDADGNVILDVALNDTGNDDDLYLGDGYYIGQFTLQSNMAYLVFPNGECVALNNHDEGYCL